MKRYIILIIAMLTILGAIASSASAATHSCPVPKWEQRNGVKMVTTNTSCKTADGLAGFTPASGSVPRRWADLDRLHDPDSRGLPLRLPHAGADADAHGHGQLRALK